MSICFLDVNAFANRILFKCACFYFWVIFNSSFKANRNLCWSMLKNTDVLSLLNHMLNFFCICLQCSVVAPWKKMLSSIYCHGNKPRRPFLVGLIQETFFFFLNYCWVCFCPYAKLEVLKNKVLLNLGFSPKGNCVPVVSHRLCLREYFISVRHNFLILSTPASSYSCEDHDI